MGNQKYLKIFHLLAKFCFVFHIFVCAGGSLCYAHIASKTAATEHLAALGFHNLKCEILSVH